MSDPLRRGLRTFAQVGTATALIQLLIAFEVPINPNQQAALVAFLTPILAFIQNLLEDEAGMPALLKAPASEGTNPVPDPEEDL